MADGGYGSKKQLSMFCEFVLIAGNQKSFLLELNESRVLISQIKLPMEQNRGMRPNESSLRMSTISEDEVAPLFVTQERELAAVGDDNGGYKNENNYNHRRRWGTKCLYPLPG